MVRKCLHIGVVLFYLASFAVAKGTVNSLLGAPAFQQPIEIGDAEEVLRSVDDSRGMDSGESKSVHLNGDSVVVECDFESPAACSGIRLTTGAYRWTTATGSTDSVGTGPDADHTLGTDRGAFAFVEASRGKKGDSAMLLTVAVAADRRDYCLSLWYNMNGKDIDQFQVLFVDANITTRGYFVLREKGDKGNKWRHLNTDIEAEVGKFFIIAMRAFRGNGYLGDIAVDDIRLTKGQCPSTEFPKSENFLLVADYFRRQIIQMDLGSGNYKAVNIQGPPMGRPVSVSYNEADKRVYWSDVTRHAIGSVFLDGTGYREYTLSNEAQPEGIDIDPGSQTIYFTDFNSGSVQTLNIQTGQQKPLLDVGLDNPRGIELDLNRRNVYITDLGAEVPGVYQADMSGGNLQHLIRNNTRWPNGIALDNQGEEIYWVDGFFGTCEHAGLDGADRKELWKMKKAGPGPTLFDVDYDQFKNLYISNWNATSIIQSPTTGGRKAFGPPIFHQAMGVAVFTGKEKQKPVVGSWGEWSKWRGCSVTCGSGQDSRTRTCIGRGCPGQSDQTRRCFAGACGGDWSLWSIWSACSTTCGLGTRSRSRRCHDSVCVGESSQKQACQEPPCTANWGLWSAWSTCSTTCGMGTRKRGRRCQGSGCHGESSQQQACKEPPCTGQWNNWDSWSRCSVTCGEGTQTRYRVCRNLNCDGRKYEMKLCRESPCLGSWHNWNSWTTCSVSCGEGLQKRNRACRSTECIGTSHQIKICMRSPCRGGWREWMDWEPCSKSCGGGQKKRFRPCDGANCQGDSDEWQECNFQACP